MKDKFRLKLALSAALISVCFCNTPLQAQQTHPTQQWTAVIGVPSEIQLSETTALPIMVQMQPDVNDKFPDKVVLHAGYGRFVDGEKNDAAITLNLRFGRGDAVLSLLGYGMSDKELFSVWVTPLTTNYPILGEAKVKLRQQSEIEFLDLPNDIPADGKSTGQLIAVIKDQYSEPMEDVTCFLQGYILDERSPTVSAHTNAQGQAVFILPTTKRVNAVGLFQVITKDIVSRQIRVDYKNPAKTETPNLQK